MLTVLAPQTESLWDESLPSERVPDGSTVRKLTAETGALLERSVKDARRLAAVARRRARGRGAKAKQRAAAKLQDARGLILPASTQPGNPSETTLLPATVAELERLAISPREVALDGGFMSGPTNTALADLAPKYGAAMPRASLWAGQERRPRERPTMPPLVVSSFAPRRSTTMYELPRGSLAAGTVATEVPEASLRPVATRTTWPERPLLVL